MDSQAQRIAWLRLALAECLSSADPQAARTAEKALNEDDAEMKEPGSRKHETLTPRPEGNRWLGVD